MREFQSFQDKKFLKAFDKKAFVPILNVTSERVSVIDFILSGEETSNFVISDDRVTEVLDKIEAGHLSEQRRKDLHDILGEFNDVFYVKGDRLSVTHLIEHTIPLISNDPVFVKQPPVPLKHREPLRQILKEYLENDIIEETSSLYNAPIFLIAKKSDGQTPPEFRPVIDYRKLNSFTCKQYYTLPCIDELLGRIGKSVIFTSLDLVKAFHQLNLAEEDREKTAFTTPYGRYHFKRAPFGLSFTPFTMSRLLDKLICDAKDLPLNILGFLDDLLIHAESEEEHDYKLRILLQKLRFANLKISLSKSKFMRTELRYLGFDLTAEGIKIPEEYKKVILGLPIPDTEKKLRGFLGKCNYVSKFIPNFQVKMIPLTRMLCKGKVIDFGTEEIASFERMKEEILKATRLSYPGKEQQYELHLDASRLGLGCMLRNKDKDSPPIMYLSRVTTDVEKKYNATELELLAFVYFARKLSFWLLANEYDVFTDHYPLLSIFESTNVDNKRLLRMKLKMADHRFNIFYCPGKKNWVCDYLSRDPCKDILVDKESDPEDAYIDFEVDYPRAPVGKHFVNSKLHLNDALEDNVLAVTRAQFNKGVAVSLSKGIEGQSLLKELFTSILVLRDVENLNRMK